MEDIIKEANSKTAICEECNKEYSPVWEGIPLCAKCDEKNWVSNPTEVQKLLLADEELKKGIFIESPYFKKEE